jgi:replication factor A1
MLARYEAVFQEANFTPYVFRVRIKVENVNDEQRVKCNIVQARPINYVQECRDLVAAIKSYQ